MILIVIINQYSFCHFPPQADLPVIPAESGIRFFNKLSYNLYKTFNSKLQTKTLYFNT